MSDDRLKAERIVDGKIKFYRNLYSYIIVNVFLFIINYLFSPQYWWFLWVAVLWGIGVVVDFFKSFVFYERVVEDYREKKIQEEIDKMNK